MRERLILATTVACALVTLIAIRNGALELGAAVVLVVALLLFVRAAFRLVDETDRREQEEAPRSWPGDPPAAPGGPPA